MKLEKNFTKSGIFCLSGEKEIQGELCVAGSESHLRVYDVKPFEDRFHDQTILGILHDLTRVTLLQCINTGTTAGYRGDETHASARLFPHYIITGNQHISSEARNIRAISFCTDDLEVLFDDRHSFETLIDAKSVISDIVQEHDKRFGWSYPTGDHAVIAFYRGNSDIISVDTVLGMVSVHHNPSYGSGGPGGVRIDNHISVTITPTVPMCFSDALARMHCVLRFFELSIGQRHSLTSVKIHLADDESPSWEPLNVFCTTSAERTPAEAKSQPSSFDVLLQPIERSQEFSSVFSNWLKFDTARRDARIQFTRAMNQANAYSIDRLVSAANMFDILPASAVPAGAELSKDIIDAKEKCRAIFKSLTQSNERDAMLGALGRLGTSTLKQKARYRAEYVLEVAGAHFPDLNIVLDEAINCRNHYVHGSESKIDYSENSRLISFFIDMLEFVFGASELIECGWDICAWLKRGMTMTHPFDFSVHGYANRLSWLKEKL